MLERIVIVLLLGTVVFLLWERFHYRQRISDLYDTVIELTAGLDPRFELRSHPQLRRYFAVDAILDDMGSKLDLLLDARSGNAAGPRPGSSRPSDGDA